MNSVISKQFIEKAVFDTFSGTIGIAQKKLPSDMMQSVTKLF